MRWAGEWVPPFTVIAGIRRCQSRGSQSCVSEAPEGQLECRVPTHTRPPTLGVSCSEVLKWRSRICISSKFSGEVEALALKCSMPLPGFVNNLLASSVKWRLSEYQPQKVMNVNGYITRKTGNTLVRREHWKKTVLLFYHCYYGAESHGREVAN